MKGLSDSQYKWTLVVCCITAIAIAFVWKYPEVVKSQQNREAKMGEYYYIDEFGVVHVDRKCSKLNSKGMTSTRHKILNFSHNYETRFCPKCVSDKDYEKLMDIVRTPPSRR